MVYTVKSGIVNKATRRWNGANVVEDVDTDANPVFFNCENEADVEAAYESFWENVPESYLERYALVGATLKVRQVDIATAPKRSDVYVHTSKTNFTTLSGPVTWDHELGERTVGYLGTVVGRPQRIARPVTVSVTISGYESDVEGAKYRSFATEEHKFENLDEARWALAEFLAEVGYGDLWAVDFLRISINRHPTWQGIMDAAYDRWQSHDAESTRVAQERALAIKAEKPELDDYCVADVIRQERRSGALLDTWGLDEFYAQLSPRELFAVVLGNFNNQVTNGGFDQWRYNGYASAAKGRVKTYLMAVGTKACALAVDALDYKNHGPYDKEEVACRKYFAVSDQVEEDVDAFLYSRGTTGWLIKRYIGLAREAYKNGQWRLNLDDWLKTA